MPAVHLYGDGINITFIHIPRTGGTSIGHWMLSQIDHTVTKSWIDYTHPSIQQVNQNFAAELGVINSFAVVRNPWDRIVSQYHYCLNPPDTRPGIAEASPQMVRHYIDMLNNYSSTFPSFEEWVFKLDKFVMPNGWWWNLTTPLSHWIDNNTTVLRFENLEEDFGQIQRLFNTDKPLPFENTVHFDHYTTYYNDQTRQIVYKWFKIDIDRWQYQFL
jgi:hypothetical protein